nr:MAG TPA: hypothetical protein [Caudoviricetes sp.]
MLLCNTLGPLKVFCRICFRDTHRFSSTLFKTAPHNVINLILCHFGVTLLPPN